MIINCSGSSTVHLYLLFTIFGAKIMQQFFICNFPNKKIENYVLYVHKSEMLYNASFLFFKCSNSIFSKLGIVGIPSNLRTIRAQIIWRSKRNYGAQDNKSVLCHIVSPMPANEIQRNKEHFYKTTRIQQQYDLK